MAETAPETKRVEPTVETDSVDRIGNAIVGATLIVLGATLLAHLAGVPFIGFIGAFALLVLGALMSRGLFGDNGTMATLMMVLGPAAIIVPPFFPGLMLIAPVIAGLFMVAGVVKLIGLW